VTAAERTRGHATRRELIDRSRARAWALQVHYRWENGGSDGSLRDALVQTQGTRRISPRRVPLLRRILVAMDDNLAEVDREIEASLDNWRLKRLSSLDRGVLRIGATELLYLEDIPPKATIQEAIRLAEAYGGNESPRFVNGVLDALYKRMQSGG
jgi:N utilization substance protein B